MSDSKLNVPSSVMIAVTIAAATAISRTIAKVRNEREREWEEARRLWVLKNTGRLPSEAPTRERLNVMWEHARTQWVLDNTGQRVLPATWPAIMA